MKPPRRRTMEDFEREMDERRRAAKQDRPASDKAPSDPAPAQDDGRKRKTPRKPRPR